MPILIAPFHVAVQVATTPDFSDAVWAQVGAREGVFAATLRDTTAATIYARAWRNNRATATVQLAAGSSRGSDTGAPARASELGSRGGPLGPLLLLVALLLAAARRRG